MTPSNTLHTMSRTRSVVLGLLALSALPSTAPADLLSTVSLSNVFVTGDAALTAINVQGEFVAGGNITLRSGNFSSIYARGNLSVTAVNVSGNASYGGTLTRVGSNIGSSGPITSPLYDFPTTAQELLAASATYGGLRVNGTVSAGPSGTLVLTGTNPELNVFDIAAPDPKSALAIDAPAGSTVLVNVWGTSPIIQSAVLNGLPGSSQAFDPTHVLFNFPGATALTLFEDDISGTVLAPGAGITVTGGWTDGTLIGGSLSARGGNFIDPPFGGNLFPDPAADPPVPEPSSLLLLGLGTALLIGWRTRRTVLAPPTFGPSRAWIAERAGGDEGRA
jgi:choice-of-anchor A domain-containing protein